MNAPAPIRILFIDDDEDDFFLFEQALSRYWPGAEATYLSDPQRLFAHLAEQPSTLPDLILVDVQMPLVTGYDLALQLLKEPRYALIPVVVYTGRLDGLDIAAFQRVGVEAVLPKPMNEQEARATVSKLRRQAAADLLTETQQD